MKIRDCIVGGDRPKGGGLMPFGDPFFGSEGAEKWDILDVFGKFWLNDPFLAPQTPTILIFLYFSEKSLNLVRVEAFIA